MWPDLIFGVILPAPAVWFARALIRSIAPGSPQPASFPALWALTAAGSSVLTAAWGALSVSAGLAISAAIALVIWWWRRKDRRRRLAALGNKARARLAALAAALKDASRGARPVLRPIPGGAR